MRVLEEVRAAIVDCERCDRLRVGRGELVIKVMLGHHDSAVVKTGTTGDRSGRTTL